jgi:predicted nucleic acid-binding protein
MIFLDSSLIVAYLNEADQNHAKALQVVKHISDDEYGTSVITDFIFDEVVTIMLVKTKDVSHVTDVGQEFLADSLVLRIDEGLFNSAWKIFTQQRKPVFSFTDCTSLAACKANGISNIATFDEDFKKLNEFNTIM